MHFMKNNKKYYFSGTGADGRSDEIIRKINFCARPAREESRYKKIRYGYDMFFGRAGVDP